jgi:hypothetical protein
MSLPETIYYGSAIGAQVATGAPYTLNKANYGSYVTSTNAVDAAIKMACQSQQRKDGVLDAWIRFEHFRNFSPLSAGVAAVSEAQQDRSLSVQIRVLAPLSTANTDGRFTQAEILDRMRGMGSILYTTDFLDKLLRGEL